MYQRNRIYISHEEQERIKSIRILIAGAGLGSNIAECALRLGFENISFCDMDHVEISNLNRQNYTHDEIDKPKVNALMKRLKAINPSAKLKHHNVFLSSENCTNYLDGVDIAINTIDFTSDAPFVFDEICAQNNIPVLHPYNLGWAGCVFVINDIKYGLRNITKDYNHAEINIVQHLILNSNNNTDLSWLEHALDQYTQEKSISSPPQLAPASWITAGICANLLFKIANDKPIKTFPDFYLLTT